MEKRTIEVVAALIWREDRFLACQRPPEKARGLLWEFAGGKVEKYYLLGAWDGDPDRRFLSYRTRLGKAVLNCRIGDSFAGPDGKDAELLSVRTLPAEIITELDA